MGHWYSKDAQPQHFINGRDSTLRDARKNNWLPSVTEIINTLDKPALTSWKVRMAVEAAQELPYEDGEDTHSYHSRVTKKAFSESLEARDKGSEIHDDIEKIWGNLEPGEYEEIAQGCCKAIISYCGGEDFRAEQIVIGEGYGGKVDLHNDEFVIDYKTKDITDEQWEKNQIYLASHGEKKPPKLAYPEMCMQLAAYDHALWSMKLPDMKSSDVDLPRKLINVFVDREIPGRVIIHEWELEESEIAYQKFELLVKYWQLSKNYFPMKA